MHTYNVTGEGDRYIGIAICMYMYIPHIDHTRATPFNAILTMKTTFGSESKERRTLEVKSTMASGRRQ